MKKLSCLILTIALLLTTVAFAEMPNTADLFRYVPTLITVTGGEVQVKGYFVNMSEHTICGFKNGQMEMVIYLDGEVLIERGSFSGSNLADMDLASGDMIPWTFTWNEAGYSLNDGDFVMDSDCYALFNGTVQFY